jgi:diguanylate cyclase (GGDEF)-like protein
MGTAPSSTRGELGVGEFAAAQWLAGAVLLTIGAVAPQAPGVHPWGVAGCAAFCLLASVLTTCVKRRVGLWFYEVSVALAMIVVAVNMVFLTGDSPAPVAGLEISYIWPAITAGYYFDLRRIAVAIGVTAVSATTVFAYLGVPTATATVPLIAIVGSVAGVTLMTHSLRRRLQALTEREADLARIDGLTGVLNRRGFDEELERELARAQRTRSPVALLLADLDHFKQLNDTCGHLEGDEALKAVAALLRGELRTGDRVARFGGDEFAVLLPGTTVEQGREIAARICLSVCHRFAAHRPPLSVSIGVADAMTGTAADLVQAADTRLYQRKAARTRLVPGDDLEVAAAPITGLGASVA